MSYAHKCLKLRGQKKVFQANKMFEFWQGLVDRQPVAPPKDKVIYVRTLENLQNKWASCIRSTMYEAVIAMAMVKEITAEPNVEEIQSALKRTRDTTENPTQVATPPKAGKDDAQEEAEVPPLTVAKKNQAKDSETVFDDLGEELPPDAQFVSWVNLHCASVPDSERSTLSWPKIRQLCAVFFGVHETALTEKKTIIMSAALAVSKSPLGSS